MGADILTVHLARRLASQPLCPHLIPFALVGATTVGLMSAVYFALHSDFRWLLLVPAVVWAVACALLAWAARKR